MGTVTRLNPVEVELQCAGCGTKFEVTADDLKASVGSHLHWFKCPACARDVVSEDCDSVRRLLFKGVS